MTATTHDDDSMLDEEWLAAPRKRSRVRLVISAALIAAVCFLGGALAQKHLGADDAASGPGALPSGFPGGDLPAGSFPGATQQGTGTASATATDTDDQVIGTVISKNGNVWVVEDLGGKRHEVQVVRDTDVVRETELTAVKVKAGDRVQITGVERNDRLRAADITLR
jgi:hypothetical protein